MMCPGGWNEPRVFDAAGLPEKLTDLTDSVLPEVRRCLAGRIGRPLADGTAWFRRGNELLALIDLKGEPAQWKVKRTVDLPRDVQNLRPPEDPLHMPVEPGIEEIKPLATDGLYALWITAKDLKSMRLQVLDVRGDGARWHPPVEVSKCTRALNVIGNHAYLATVPDNVGNECSVRPFDGMRFKIYDLTDPAGIKPAGEWAPSKVNRAMWLHPHPERPGLVVALEPRMGFGFHVCDFSDPVRPKVLAHVPTNGGGSGHRVAAWGDRAMYSCSLKAMWYDTTDPRAPRELGTWHTFNWFRVLHVYGEYAIVSGYDDMGQVIDFRDPKSPKEVAQVPCDAAWGARVYGVRGGGKNEKARLSIHDLSDPGRPKRLYQGDFELPASVFGAWADGPYLYAVSGGAKGEPTLVIWDVSDPSNPRELSRYRHPELELKRGNHYWTAHGRSITAARGIVLITSYQSGAPQVIDARNPRDPKFLMRLPVKEKDWSDSFPDGPHFYVKSPGGPVEAWDFTKPEEPRRVWEELPLEDVKSWVAGQPVGDVLLAPKGPHLKIVTVPRPSQAPSGEITERTAGRR